MRTLVLLLAMATASAGAPVSLMNLKELLQDINTMLDRSGEKVMSIFVPKLVPTCESLQQYFCHAKKVLSEHEELPKAESHKIIRHLGNHVKTCEIKKHTEETLKAFLEKLKSCVQVAIRKTP